MTKKSMTEPKLNSQDKAERTTLAAANIMSEERRSSDAKVARLRALRLAQAPAAPEPVKAPAARAPKRASAATLRKLALEPGAAPRKRGTS